MEWGRDVFHQLLNPPTILIPQMKKEGEILLTPPAPEGKTGECGLCLQEGTSQVYYVSTPLSLSEEEGEEAGGIKREGGAEDKDLSSSSSSLSSSFFCSQCVGVVNHLSTLKRKITKLQNELDCMLEVIEVWRRMNKGDEKECSSYPLIEPVVVIKEEKKDDINDHMEYEMGLEEGESSFVLYPEGEGEEDHKEVKLGSGMEEGEYLGKLDNLDESGGTESPLPSPFFVTSGCSDSEEIMDDQLIQSLELLQSEEGSDSDHSEYEPEPTAVSSESESEGDEDEEESDYETEELEAKKWKSKGKKVKKEPKERGKAGRGRPRKPKEFACGSCSEKFSLRIKYIHHLKSTGHVEGSSLFQAKKHPTKSLAEKLVPKNIPGPPFNCPSCTLQFKARKNFVRHYLDKHCREHGRFKCDLCNVSYWAKQPYIIHTNTSTHRQRVMEKEGLKELPARKPLVKCKDCGKDFHSSGSYNYHRSAVHDDGPKICEQCGKSYKTIFNLRSHIKIAHNPNPNAGERIKKEVRETGTGEVSANLACPHCEKFFKARANLYQHIRVVHKKGTRFVTTDVPSSCLSVCELCGKAFGHPSSLATHIYLIHKNARKFACSQCDKAYYNRHSLQLHIAAHHTTLEERLHCKECNQTFENLRQRKIHDRSVHELKKTFECPICHKVFPFLAQMTRHKEGAHDKDIICSKCGKKFVTKSGLKKHWVSICEPDPKEIQRVKEYSKRKYTQYREHKPWKCEGCGQGFPENRMLKKHKEHCREVPPPSSPKVDEGHQLPPRLSPIQGPSSNTTAIPLINRHEQGKEYFNSVNDSHFPYHHPLWNYQLMQPIMEQHQVPKN